MNNKHFLNFKTFKSYYETFNFPLLNIISVNMRSISSIEKFNKFKIIISKLPKLPSVIAVQETWFSSDLAKIYNIFGYNVVHCCRSDGYGGTSIFIHNSLEYMVETCESKNFIERITISLENHKINGKSLKVTSFYRSQKCCFNEFSSFVENLLTSCGRHPSIIVCDSNIDFLRNPLSFELSDILSSFNYKNCHTLITRPESNTCIDNVYSNITEDIFIDTIACSLTDHNILSCKIKTLANNSEYVETIRQVCDYSLARQSLANLLQSYQETGNPSEDSSRIITCISNAAKSSTIEKREIKSIKNEMTPWLNKNLLELINYKKKLLKMRRRGRYDVESRLKRLSNVIRKACRECMNNYYINNLSQIQQEPKKCWNFLNENLGRKRKSEINIKDDNGNLIAKDRQSDVFNQYFLKIPRTLKQQMECLPGDHCNSLRTLNQCRYNFNFTHTSELEISEIISKLDLSKSCGYDEISPKMLFQCRDIISPYFTSIFNSIIDTSVYPESLKIAKIVPIPKENNATLVEKFRPIALLPLIDKIFEKILYKQLSCYLNENNLLYGYQYGFKKGCGTEEAVVNVINNICNGLDNGFSGVAGIFYDFSKAFDLVDHDILIEKLRYYGVERRALYLLKSYLKSRKQYVEINCCKSYMGNVEYGVPQGSVLGPLLFTLYLNDIQNLQLFGKLIMFADDISVFYPYKHETALKAHMEYDAAMIAEYARINKLMLNAEKTKLIRFRPYLVHNQDFSIFVDGREICETLNTKYLGVILQSNLSWEMHIKQLKSKIVSATGLLYKFKNKFTTETKMIIYQALAHSHLNYLPIIYAYKKSNELKSLQRAQNKALKTVFNLPITFSTLNLYKDVSKTVLPVFGLYKMKLLLYVFKSINGIGYHTISFSRNQFAFNTRNAMNLRVARCRLETTRQRVEHAGSLEYNHLPDMLKNTERISIFKRNIKEFLLENIEMLLL